MLAELSYLAYRANIEMILVHDVDWLRRRVYDVVTTRSDCPTSVNTIGLMT